jgi:4-amino-4-deoxy-L-arabinose transferase-like glycosyltransferase
VKGTYDDMDVISFDENKSRGWSAIAIFLLAFLPRVFSLDIFLTIDEVKWLTRSEQFLQALLRQDFSATYLSAHPGIINYWLILSGVLIRYLLQFGVTFERAHWSQGLQEFAAVMLFGGTPNLDFLASGRLLFALVTSVCVSVSYLLSRKLFSQRVAFLGAALLALDPFYMAFSRLLVTDALVASFTTLSLLSFIMYLTHRRKWRYVIFSGITAGLAFLTKVPSLVLVPTVGVLAMLTCAFEGRSSSSPRRKNIGQLALALVTWGLIAGLVCLALWPALWVEPLGTIHQLWRGLTSKEIGGRLQFFMGKVTDDPGFWFYWVVALFRLTPLTLLGLLFGASSLMPGSKKPRTSEGVARVTMLMTFVLLFSFSITLEPSKFDRYLLPVFPVVEIIAAMGLCTLVEEVVHRLSHSPNWLGRWATDVGQRRWVAAGCFASLAVQALFALPQHPYYLSFYNPLAGGPSQASRILLVGHGEGLDGAARYLNQKDNASELVVATAFRPGLAPFFRGETVDLRKTHPTDVWPWLRADYVVLNIWELQREGSTQVVSLFRSQKPEHLVKIKGVEYTWIYRNRKNILSQVPSPQYAAGGNLAGKALLLGYDLYEPPARAVESGGMLHVTAYWQCLEAMDQDYSVYIRLKDEAGHTWGQVDDWPVKGLLPTSQWAPGMIVRDDYDVEVLPGTPPGYYRIEVGMYSVDETKGTELLGQWRASQQTVQVVKPTAPPPLERLAIQHPLQVRLGSQIKLVGYNYTSQAVRPGDSIPLTLFWQAEQNVREDDLVLLQLCGEDGKMWALYRDRPANGSYPTTRWSRGEVVRQQLEVRIPADVRSGSYDLAVALADASNGRKTERVALAQLTVEGRPRVFEVPPIQHPLTANLSNRVEFLGYDLPSGEIKAGDTLSLTLYWKAMAEMDTSYTVFVHVLDSENSVWGQRDSLPGEDSLPTTGWLPGEVIVDQYKVPIQPDAQPGQYVIEVGMYQAETGQRLPIINQKGQIVDDRVLLEEVTVQK